jgi:Trypsin-co-occurring domain 2
MNKVGLKEAIESLRVELGEAILLGDGKAIKFEVPEVEMEFQVAMEESSQGTFGVRWVIDIGGTAGEKISTTHKLKIFVKKNKRIVFQKKN